MSFSFKQLRYFSAVVETGKVSGAALAVNISPSSITEAIKGLEHFLGAELFRRTRTGLELTPEGYRFHVYASRILNDVESARHSIRDDKQAIEGTIRICTTVTVSGYFLSRLLKNFKRLFPKVELIVEESTREEIEDKIENQNIDLAILLVSNVSPEKQFNIVPLVRSQRRLWVSADHPLLKTEIVTLEDVAREPYVQLTMDEAARTSASLWGKHNLNPNVIMHTSSVEAVRSLVATGAGVTILSDMVFRPWSVDGDRINTLEIKESIPSMDAGLLWSKNKTDNDLAKCFIDFCRLQYSPVN